MLKGALLLLARTPAVRQMVMRHDLLRDLAHRYVAGEDLDDGVAVALTLNTQRLLVSLDHLGESVEGASDAEGAVRAYLDALEAIAHEGIEGSISLKLTQLGLDVSRDVAVTHLRTILDRARELGIFVRIDMESSAYTQRTLDVHQELWSAGYRNVGIVLQAYLYRTADDVDRAIEHGVGVRLCKGAYLEPARVAYPHKADVDANYERLMRKLLVGGQRPAIATHDAVLIQKAQEFCVASGISPRSFDFEMLFGVRRDLQLALVAQGYQVRVYLPYGQQWYPYLVRRLAERPANLGFFLRTLAAEALSERRDGRR